MGLFDGLLGGAVGAEVATAVSSLIEKHGGVQGVITQLEQQGLGGTVRSWVGTAVRTRPLLRGSSTPGLRLPTPSRNWPRRWDCLPQDLATKLSAFLPQAIDKLTPGGTIPKV